MRYVEEYYDVAVVGAGHAGCEAALACARLGLETVLFTVSVESIALMPCNPSIGGSSKGHLVREVDALGGEMGRVIDRTFLQSRMLNRSKGPAVHSLRAQADKAAYSALMRQTLENCPHLTIRQTEVSKILTAADLEKIAVQCPGIHTAAQAAAIRRAADGDNGCDEENISISIDTSKVTGVPSTTDISTINDSLAAAGEADAEKNKSTTIEQSTFETDGTAGEVGTVGANDTQDGIESITVDMNELAGVQTISGAVYHCRAAVLCTGTYLKARCIYGDVSSYTGPNGLQAANHLTDSLLSHGIDVHRFKTGTPARMDGKTIDYSKLERQDGDDPVIPFSFETDPASVQIEQKPVWLTYTNAETHRIIRENLDRSPLYGGVIHSTGPRYCPSIEDKVVRFPDRERHQVFLEPEGAGTNEMYVGGMSSSMPEDVQIDMYRTVPGLEHARIVKNAYAIEYDCIDAMQLNPTLEFKKIPGLFSAGQFNGSSGYEEAAAQGLIAGINAAMKLKGRDMLVIDRSEGYIGVLIDDLVTRENTEPYRMMTSRAEYRLLLRQDNADLRLTGKGYRVGLISEERWQKLCVKREQITAEAARVEQLGVRADELTNALLSRLGSAPLKTSATLAELIRRPELSYEELAQLDPDRPALPADVREEVNIEIKYRGYIERQERQVEQFRKMEGKKIPADIDYDAVPSLRTEARQKLSRVRPLSVGQAGRISGVTPADVSVLLVWLQAHGTKGNDHDR